jgi:hypothetical protein
VVPERRNSLVRSTPSTRIEIDERVSVSPALFRIFTPSLVLEIPRYAIGTFSGIGWELIVRKRMLPVIIVIAMSRRIPIMLEKADSWALFFIAGSDPDLRRG